MERKSRGIQDGDWAIVNVECGKAFPGGAGPGVASFRGEDVAVWVVGESWQTRDLPGLFNKPFGSLCHFTFY